MLAELPLMLAGLPQSLGELLREVGVPAAPLPEWALSAAGVGRFVLYDSRSAESAAAAIRAQGQGLEAIDLQRTLGPFAEAVLGSDLPTMSAAQAATCIDLLKAEIEARGGVWMRLADYPFPYQSAMCLSVDHDSVWFERAAEIAAAIPGKVTHFVPPDVPAVTLASLAQTSTEWGWLIEDPQQLTTSRKSVSTWKDWAAQFRSAGIQVPAVSSPHGEVDVETRQHLWSLGLSHACHARTGAPCRAEPLSSAEAGEVWVRFGTIDLGASPAAIERPSSAGETFTKAVIPERLRRAVQRQQRIDSAHALSDELRDGSSATAMSLDVLLGEWINEHYRSGTPLFVHEPSSRCGLRDELTHLIHQASRCSLLWQTTYGQFAAWWRLRRRINFQVWKRGAGHELHVDPASRLATCGVEIWRGSHVAMLPIKEPVVSVPEGGLVFINSPGRHPAGLAALVATESPSMTHPAIAAPLRARRA